MCGIAGIIQTDPSRYTREHLEKMTAALAHRGPDGSGTWQNTGGNVWLGHRRLSIIDLTEAGHQPLHYLGRYTIIHNGEVYNYIELKETLQKKGYSFQSATDTEVIAAAYDHWQEECVDHFDGMFSFGIWDEKEKRFFAARDRFGEKPFYFHLDGTTLLFASEMKALWAAGVEKTPNQKMLFNFITIGYTDNPAQPGETFFSQVFKLPAASTLHFSLDNPVPVLEKYWDLEPEEQDRLITDEQAREKFQQLFVTSVNRRLRSDVGIGTCLSGGLDSSAVAATASSLLIHERQVSPLDSPHTPFSAFTAIFPGFEKDESAYARQVAEQLQLEQHTLSVSAGELMRDLEKLFYHQEEPVGSSSVYPQFRLFELARQRGVKVLLDGQGADEILAGYHKYYKWYWQELFRARTLSRSKELAAARELGVPETFGLKNMIAAYFPGFATVFMERQYLLKSIRQEDLDRDFVKSQSNEAYYTTPDRFTLNGALYFNTCMHGLEELLRYADRNAMAHGREVRLPFLSHELVEFIFSLPANFKIRKGWTKWLLRETMKDKLPEPIVWRKDKVGFEPPQQAWMQDPQLTGAIQSAKQVLVDQHILKKDVLDKKIIPQPAHATDNFDWRYLSAAYLFRS